LIACRFFLKYQIEFKTVLFAVRTQRMLAIVFDAQFDLISPAGESETPQPLFQFDTPIRQMIGARLSG
jgi:hypothetical protein